MRIEDIIAAVEADGRAVLVVIERVAGSTPREVGAAMLVSASGVRGTIGGGAVEHRAGAIAHAMIAAGPAPPLGRAAGSAGSAASLARDGAGHGPTDTFDRVPVEAAPHHPRGPGSVRAPSPDPASGRPAEAAARQLAGRRPAAALHPRDGKSGPVAAAPLDAADRKTAEAVPSNAEGHEPVETALSDAPSRRAAADAAGANRAAASPDVAAGIDALVTAAEAEPAGMDAAAFATAPGNLAFAPQRLAFPLGPVLDQCCGGHMTLLFAPLARADLSRLKAAATITADRDRRRHLALWPGAQVYVEPPRPRPVFVYGGGHVGAALVTALAPLPFEVRWIDARARGFIVAPPAGVESRLTPLPEAEALAAPPDAFHVVLTHSHALDLEIVAAVLEHDAFGFLGLIGSATKKALFVRRLRERGIPAERLDRLTCPIGLPDLRDKRPAVIGASTAAQLLQIDASDETHRGDLISAGRPLACEPESVSEPTSQTPSPAGV